MSVVKKQQWDQTGVGMDEPPPGRCTQQIEIIEADGRGRVPGQPIPAAELSPCGYLYIP